MISSFSSEMSQHCTNFGGSRPTAKHQHTELFNHVCTPCTQWCCTPRTGCTPYSKEKSYECRIRKEYKENRPYPGQGH